MSASNLYQADSLLEDMSGALLLSHCW